MLLLMKKQILTKIVYVCDRTENPSLTTRFQRLCGDVHAPENCVVFVGDEEHSCPEKPKPSIHILDYG